MTRGDPILRAVPRPADININGNIFGGWVLSQMDVAGGILARDRARGPVATVAIEAMHFIRPILLGDIVSLYGHVQRVGTTSIAVWLEVVATRGYENEEVVVTNGVFTFVALDGNQRPTPVPVT
ncbi:acyl-CoA thioesterase [Sphingomonas naphthae]|uniref:Acyl-CoA thioesterase n=1 Tax=Sphingomonas naphthae TaxID=1813468 RepID=A0ABY7TK98_9SPHN|nr:acyl-CoA thioesterase [Sphingomonas naphthae]WCT73137.1 acyl-CoA thioesterase [Sphingomonas naphthae]